VKTYVAEHNKTFETKQLTIEGFTHTTPDMWRGFRRHVVDVENKYFEQDGLTEDMIGPGTYLGINFVICICIIHV